MRARAVAAVIVAVYCGLLLSGLAARIAWGMGEKPINTTLAEPALVLAVPAAESLVDHGEAAPAPSDEGWEGALPAPSHHTYRWRGIQAWPGALDTIHQRLTEAGWQVGRRVGDDVLRQVFWAQRDAHLLRVLGGVDRGAPTVILQLFRTEPPGVLPAAVGGLLFGGAGTWLIARWILRREGMPRWTRLAGGTAVVIAGILSTLTVASFLLIDWWTTHDLQLPLEVFSSLPAPAIATLLALSAYALKAARTPTTAPTPAESPAA
jgi:hypothetical protein